MLLLFRYVICVLQDRPFCSCVCICIHVYLYVYAHASVIFSHTCVGQKLHPAAPLSCCHGELPLAYSKCIGPCVFICATLCFALNECVCTHARSCVLRPVCTWCKCLCDYLCACVCAKQECQPVFYWAHVSSAIKH